MILKKVNENDYKNIAEGIKDLLNNTNKNNYIITLTGAMGAGKTTFVKHLAKQLSVGDEIQSPTFTIMREYDLDINKKFKKLLHIDAYRFENKNEGNILKLDNRNSSVIVVEWPDNMNLPEIDLKIKIEKNNEYANKDTDQDNYSDENLYRDIVIE